MEKGKKILSILLAVLLLAGCLPMMATAASSTAYTKGAPAGGNYTISTAEQLKALAETVNGGEDYEGTTFTLTQDIDLNGSENNQWEPIGYYNYPAFCPFNGTFEGNNHKINGLYINAPNGECQGLFGYVNASGTVKNLGVYGFIAGGYCVGGIVGVNGGKVANCYNACDVTGDISCIGGIAGSNGRGGGIIGPGIIENCYNIGNITCNSGYVGGAIGSNMGILRKCYSVGTVSGDTGVGGMVGYHFGSGDCYYLENTVFCNSGNKMDRLSKELTAEEFKLIDSFQKWDFDDIWEMGKDANGNPVRPIFKNNKEENIQPLSDDSGTDTPENSGDDNSDDDGDDNTGGNTGGTTPTPSAPDDSENEKPTVSVSDFKDVSATEYYYNAIDWAVKQGVAAGTSDTAFSPNQNTTRAQTVTFLWRAAGRPEPKTAVSPFTDVSKSEYYYDAVLWAYENRIVAGTSASTFSPDQKCTRAQTVTFLYRYNGSPAASGSNQFTDVPDHKYYANAVAWATANKIVFGTSEDKFSPESSCTRAQSVTFLYRNLAE